MLFLAQASAVLAASLDYKEAMESFANLAVPQYGDWCVIDIKESDQDEALTRVAVVHKDREKVEFARAYQEHYPPTKSQGVARVMQTGKAEIYPEITAATVQESIADQEQLQIVLGLGLRSAILVPLQARGRTLGVLTLVMADSGRTYGAADLVLAEEFARRASIAVDNARLFKELQKAIEAKDEFLGVVSHELRTPITTISGASRLLRSRADRLDAQMKSDLLADIEQEADHLARLIDDLLLLARVKLGESHAWDPVLINRCVEKICASWQRTRPHRELRMHLEEDLAPVAGEETYIEQTLRNYLSNAEKYSPSDAPIEIHAKSNNDEVLVSVLDRGPGVRPEELEQIFERFYRSEQTAHKARGLGIGLTACKRLMEAQSGRVWAKPRDGGGLEIGFALPVYKEEGKHDN